jgi:acetylornithine deacetylase/succinyl-diaminopimelate desuccinylase-like protein
MQNDRKKNIEELKEFLRFPSISADSSQKASVLDCAKWLCHHLEKIGLQKVELHPTRLHPVVYAEQISNPSYKTILFYGHYDVQPVDPVKQWTHPPFQPVIKNNYLYARGASDDKGQLFVHIKAIEELLREEKKLPVNIKCVFEGEEEIGSPHLGNFLLAFKKKLSCDVAVVSDTKISSADQPAITYSLRGSLNAEINIRGHSKDLHSGTFGGMIENPGRILSLIVAGLFDNNNRITIPGFYENVKPVPETERSFMRVNGPPDRALLSDAGAIASAGEKKFSNYERTVIRPSLTICGINCGYTGEGVKNILPSTATVKINMRLVPYQDHKKIALSLMGFVKDRLPHYYKLNIKFSSAADPVEVSRSHPYIRAAAMAYHQVFSVPPKFLRSGGTIPVVSLLGKILGIPVVLMGFALATDDMHAPDEKFYLPNFFRGILTSKLFMKKISTLK